MLNKTKHLRLTVKGSKNEEVAKGATCYAIVKIWCVIINNIANERCKASIMLWICNTLGGPVKGDTLKAANASKMKKVLHKWFLKPWSSQWPKWLKRAKLFNNKLEKAENIQEYDYYLFSLKSCPHAQDVLVQRFKYKLLHEIKQTDLCMTVAFIGNSYPKRRIPFHFKNLLQGERKSEIHISVIFWPSFMIYITFLYVLIKKYKIIVK